MPTNQILSARMIRAARGLLGLEQSQLADLVGVARRTIIRIEADETEPTNPRRREIHEAIRNRLEKEFGIRFVFADKTTGEGVVMRKGR
jgi:transcriptional regulator with XRE-family HTH domain